MSSYRATVILGSHQLAVYFRALGQTSQGAWGVFEDGLTAIRPTFVPLGLRFGDARHSTAPIFDLQRTATQNDTESYLDIVSTRIQDGVLEKDTWSPHYLNATWKKKCDEASRVLRHEVADVYQAAGVTTVTQLNVLYFRPDYYVPNILCNALGKALNMSTSRGKDWQLESYGWDERPMFNIRRGHVTDWVRHDAGHSLVISERNATLGERRAGRRNVHSLWRWDYLQKRRVQRLEDEKEAFCEIARGTELQTTIDQTIKVGAYSLELDSDLRKRGITNVFWDTGKCIKKTSKSSVSHWHLGRGDPPDE